MSMPTILELLQSGAHFGHQKGRWHPKMKPFVFTERSGVHVIDLEKTVEKLQLAADFAKKVAANGGVILFVGTKSQGKEIIRQSALDSGMPFIVERWIGGLFTNYANVRKLIRKYQDLKEKKESGAFAKYTKKEQVDFNKQIDKLEKLVGGLKTMTKMPEAIFILDAKREKTAISEARIKKIPVIGFCDTNINPELLDYPIPANDDAVKSITLITGVIAEAVKTGRAQAEQSRQ